METFHANRDGGIMEKSLDIICQHLSNGDIIPIKVRLADEDGEFHIFQVKSYKVIDRPGDVCLPNLVNTTVSLWTFECKILVFGNLKIIRLHYNTYNGRWWVAV